MLTATFALIAGIDPRELHGWFCSMYAGSYKWVELPDVTGVSQFADGGLLASNL